MKIEQVEMRLIKLPLLHPFETSFGVDIRADHDLDDNPLTRSGRVVRKCYGPSSVFIARKPSTEPGI